MPSHDIATDIVAPYIASEIDHYPELVEAGVTFDALFAFGEDNQPAGVKHQGFPATATIKINGPTLRQRDIPDATLVIEGMEWEAMTEDQRAGMVAHYLAYVVVTRDAKGVIKEDKAGRPKVRVGPPDYRVAGFRSVASRHGGNSIEVQDAAAFREAYGPLLFGDGAELPQFAVA